MISIAKKIAVGSGIAAFGALELCSGWTIVDGNSAACFHNTFTQKYDCGNIIAQRLPGGQEVQGPSYYGNGFYLKWPVITAVDQFQINNNDLGEKTVSVNIGSENQQATITYKPIIKVPREGMISASGKYVSGGEYLNYSIGQFGSADIPRLVTSRMDAAFQIGFAPIDPANLSTQRDATGALVRKTIEDQLSEMGVQVTYLAVKNAQMNSAWETAAAVRIQAKAQKEAAIDYAAAVRTKAEGEGDAEVTRSTKHALALTARQAADAAYGTAMMNAYRDPMAAALSTAWSQGTGPVALGAGVVVSPDRPLLLKAEPAAQATQRP